MAEATQKESVGTMTEAEQKDADAKALAAKKHAADAAKLAEKEIVIVGGPGPFSIEGPGLGAKGRLTVNGLEIATTRWDDRSVRGVMPEGLEGAVALTRLDGVVRRGTYSRP